MKIYIFMYFQLFSMWVYSEVCIVGTHWMWNLIIMFISCIFNFFDVGLLKSIHSGYSLDVEFNSHAFLMYFQFFWM